MYLFICATCTYFWYLIISSDNALLSLFIRLVLSRYNRFSPYRWRLTVLGIYPLVELMLYKPFSFKHFHPKMSPWRYMYNLHYVLHRSFFRIFVVLDVDCTISFWIIYRCKILKTYHHGITMLEQPQPTSSTYLLFLVCIPC